MGKEASGLGFWGTVFATVLAAGFLAVWSGVWSWAVGIAGRFWVHLGGAVLVPVWLLYVLGACALAVLVGFAAWLWTLLGPEWKTYTADSFFGADWEWHYFSGNIIGGLWAYCPACKTSLIYNETLAGWNQPPTVALHCERCRRDVVTHQGDKDYLLSVVKRQIHRNIRTDEWPRPEGQKKAKA